MEKIEKPIINCYKRVKLYIEDLKNIESILKEASGPITLKTEEHMYDSVDDLVKNLKDSKISKLHIGTEKPYITIDFSYVSTDSTIGAGIYHKLDGIITKCIPKYMIYFNKYFVSFMFGTYVLWLSFMILSSKVIILRYMPFAIFLACILLIWFIFYLCTGFKACSTIVLLYKKSQKSFFQRNKDNLILVAITIFLTVVATEIVRTIIGHFFTNNTP